MIPQTPDEIARGTQERAGEDMLYLHYTIEHLEANAREMDPVEVLEQ